MHTWDVLVFAQSECLVKGAVNKIPVWLVCTVRVDNEYLFWNRPGQSLHKRHIRVSVLICHSLFSSALNHTNTVDSALTQDALTNLFGLFLVIIDPSCVAKARCVYESENSFSDLDSIFYGIACLWFHHSSSLIFFISFVYRSNLGQKTWIPGFVDFSDVRKKVQKWCLTRPCSPQYQNPAVFSNRYVCRLENFIQDRARVFKFQFLSQASCFFLFFFFLSLLIFQLLRLLSSFYFSIG